MTLPTDTIIATNWQCPHCLMWSSLDDSQYSKSYVEIGGNSKQLTRLIVNIVICKNATCKKATITADLIGMIPYGSSRGGGSKLGRFRWFALEPNSKAKSQPPYIPQGIIDDYEEAYLISCLSPKASATLSRRCLQGMIRDFFSIRKNSLFDEINAIKDQTTADIWEAIDAVRKIGNIGAHMEKDINVIVDVDEDEAHLLLSLIEQLFEDWYVTRHMRQERLAAIKNAAAEKEALKKGSSNEITPC
jgi:Domain of unknown function (DUF4145)